MLCGVRQNCFALYLGPGQGSGSPALGAHKVAPLEGQLMPLRGNICRPCAQALVAKLCSAACGMHRASLTASSAELGALASQHAQRLRTSCSSLRVQWGCARVWSQGTRCSQVVGDAGGARSFTKAASFSSAWCAAQGDLNLNICEAHAFNTVDRFSLDVFVVNGWSGQARAPDECSAPSAFPRKCACSPCASTPVLSGAYCL